ncbi:HAD-IB family hydrolase [Aestuariimicrobium kwangyangense]|uniref:HAD-IB family hydrolase n=1 Tax=Aestuariimicrobium kwangyangense TaxID=396389 RepID=UPI0003B64B6B|nr:HAD-IB family hydrolase [Aestuariimicrobium kwangyangense]
MSTRPVRRQGPAATFGEYHAAHLPPLLDGRLRDLLAGQKILLTGVTGFIGEQLLWKILTELPDTRVAVLVRRKGSVTAHERVVSLARKKIFKPLVEAAGGPEQLVDDRIEVIEGDLPHVPDLPRDLDVLIHCAGDVSFDPPIDEAFKTNVLGTQALIGKLIEACTDQDGTLHRIPHYVHISTAYTAGRRRGAIPEEAHAHGVDYEAETRHALSLKEHIETQSRTSEQLTALRKQAERQHQQAGYLTTAADTERRRAEWVKRKLVEAGTERARSLGWTDVYTFAKAMGERVVADLTSSIKVSIVRPAIVESSLVDPFPGWIEGFKMADPIILAYARGELPEFPASPDAVIDIVPCDHVVNAIVAVAATEPEIGRPEYYHSNSGARNPLTFRGVHDICRAYFTAHPFIRNGEPVPAVTWKFPGAAPIEKYLALAERAHAVGERLLSFAPRSVRTREAAIALDKQAEQLAFFRKYFSLYGEYLQSELHFVDDSTLALHQSLHPDDVEHFSFDTGQIDWDHYLGEVHIPAIINPVQRLELARTRRGERSSTYKALKPSPTPVLAVFDLDGTVMATNVVETYLWATLPDLPLTDQVKEVAKVASHLPAYLASLRRDRGNFLRQVYRRYAGMPLDELNAIVDTRMRPFIMDRLAHDALTRIQEHREVGHTTVLLTGAVRPFTRPIADLFDVVVAAELSTDDQGVCTGFLDGPPMVGETRSAWLRQYATLHGYDLAKSYAYADSHVDLPMLTAVGNPVVVSPDVGLLRAARQNGWSVVDWPVSAERRRFLPQR